MLATNFCTHPELTCAASKTLAEKALWQFIEVEQPHWDGVTINPSMVWGPLLQQAATIKDINESTGEL